MFVVLLQHQDHPFKILIVKSSVRLYCIKYQRELRMIRMNGTVSGTGSNFLIHFVICNYVLCDKIISLKCNIIQTLVRVKNVILAVRYTLVVSFIAIGGKYVLLSYSKKFKPRTCTTPFYNNRLQVFNRKRIKNLYKIELKELFQHKYILYIKIAEADICKNLKLIDGDFGQSRC